LAAKNNIFVLNSPGTIDSDYKDEVKIILANFSNKSYTVNIGDRIAQLIFKKKLQVNVYELSEDGKKELIVSQKVRKSGFGHTGK